MYTPRHHTTQLLRNITPVTQFIKSIYIPTSLQCNHIKAATIVQPKILYKHNTFTCDNLLQSRYSTTKLQYKSLLNLLKQSNHSLIQHRTVHTTTQCEQQTTPQSNTTTVGTSWKTPTGNVQENLANLQSTYQRYKPKIVLYARIGGVIIFAYTLFSATMYIVDFFTTINFLDVGQAFFAAGFVTALGLCGIVYAINRLITIKPDTIYNIVLTRLLNNSNTYSIQTQQLLGDNLKAGDFRAYSYIAPTWRSAAQRKQYLSENSESTIRSILLRYYQPKRLQLFFSLNGSKGQGIVSCEVENQYRGSKRPKFILLAIDNLTMQQRVVLYGDPEYSIYKGIIKLR